MTDHTDGSRPTLGDLIASLIDLLENPDATFSEEDIEALQAEIAAAARQEPRQAASAALRRLGQALYGEDLDEVSEALLIAACRGPLEASGDPTPVAEAIVSFAQVTLPVCCSYFLLLTGAPDDASPPSVEEALEPLLDRFPLAGFEVTALQWTAGTLAALAHAHPASANELRESIFVIPALYALAPMVPPAATLLRELDPALADRRAAPRPAPAPADRPPPDPRDGRAANRGPRRPRRDS